jgi:hypothetical protein
LAGRRCAPQERDQVNKATVDLSTLDIVRMHIFRKGVENPIMIITQADEAISLRARFKASYASVVTVRCLGLDGSVGELDVVVSEVGGMITEPFDVKEAQRAQAEREAAAQGDAIRRSLAPALAPMLVPPGVRRKAA